MCILPSTACPFVEDDQDLPAFPITARAKRVQKEGEKEETKEEQILGKKWTENILKDRKKPWNHRIDNFVCVQTTIKVKTIAFYLSPGLL